MVAAMTLGDAHASALQCELRCGDWQVELADVGEVDLLCADPPYGERTHSKQFHGRRKQHTTRGCANDERWITSKGLNYASWSPEDVHAFVGAWSPRVRGWFVAMTSHDLTGAYEDALNAAGRYVFAPLPIVMPGMNVRLAGDGPSSWCVWLMVARPRTMKAWGTLRGAYVGSPGQGVERAVSIVPGAKPLWLMRALVRDYSRPGDLIVDPCAGGATTLIAARMEGRRSIGAERDPKTFELASARIAKPYTPLLFGDELRARAVVIANDNGVEQGELVWAKATSGEVDP